MGGYWVNEVLILCPSFLAVPVFFLDSWNKNSASFALYLQRSLHNKDGRVYVRFHTIVDVGTQVLSTSAPMSQQDRQPSPPPCFFALASAMEAKPVDNSAAQHVIHLISNVLSTGCVSEPFVPRTSFIEIFSEKTLIFVGVGCAAILESGPKVFEKGRGAEKHPWITPLSKTP